VYSVRRVTASFAALVVVASLAGGVSGQADASTGPPPIRQLPKQASVNQAPKSVVARVPLSATRDRKVVAIQNGPNGPRVITVSATDAIAAERKVGQLQADPATVSVAIDRKVKALSMDRTADQWALTKLSTTSAWDLSTGSGVKVAVVDTGVQASHPDLGSAVVDGAEFLGTSTSTGNGEVDGNGHGTHVAGIVAANHDGDLVTGISPSANVMPVRVLDAAGSGDTSDVDSGIIWAVDNGADIVSMSLGGPDASDTDLAAISYATSRGVAVVAAAGNDGALGRPSYPGAYPGVIAVSALSSNDVIGSYSNRGSYIDIAAPGSSILSDYPTSTVKLMSGTSMATPYVSGAIALVLAKMRETNAGATALQATDLLLANSHDLGATGRDDLYGAGRVDPLAALTALAAPPTESASPTPSATVSPSQTATPLATPSVTPSPSASSPIPTAMPTPTPPTVTQTAEPSPRAPSSPRQVQAKAWGRRAVLVQFSTPNDPGSSAIASYQLRCAAKGRTTRSAVVKADQRSARITGLVAGSRYGCDVRAYNGRYSQWSPRARTQVQDIPTAPKINPNRSQPIAGSRKIVITVLKDRATFPTVTKYRAKCTPVSSRGRVVTAKSKNSAVTVSGLIAGRRYVCRVARSNSLGTSTWSTRSIKVRLATR